MCKIQFPVPHTRGSSHGQSRIVRCLYPSMCYAKTSFDSFALWKQLEKEVDDKLLMYVLFFIYVFTVS